MSDGMPIFGLQRVSAALAPLADNTQLLEQQRDRRFNRDRIVHDHPPPPYRSHESPEESLPSTVEASTPSPEHRTKAQITDLFSAVEKEAENSTPYEQFAAQVRALAEEEREEARRISRESASRDYYLPEPQLQSRCRKKVRAAWIEQGIWENHWEKDPGPSWTAQDGSSRWRHEYGLKSLSELEQEAEEAKAKAAAPKHPYCRPRQPEDEPPAKTEEEARNEKQRELEQRIERRNALLRARDKTRPLQQFLYQIDKERERLLSEHGANEGNEVNEPSGTNDEAVPTSFPQDKTLSKEAEAEFPDIGTKAYENVKETWVKRGIWRKTWTVLPGLYWKHELRTRDLAREELGEERASKLPGFFFTGQRRPPPVVEGDGPLPDPERMASLLAKGRTGEMTPPTPVELPPWLQPLPPQPQFGGPPPARPVLVYPPVQDEFSGFRGDWFKEACETALAQRQQERQHIASPVEHEHSSSSAKRPAEDIGPQEQQPNGGKRVRLVSPHDDAVAEEENVEEEGADIGEKPNGVDGEGNGDNEPPVNEPPAGRATRKGKAKADGIRGSPNKKKAPPKPKRPKTPPKKKAPSTPTGRPARGARRARNGGNKNGAKAGVEPVSSPPRRSSRLAARAETPVAEGKKAKAKGKGPAGR